MESRSTPRVTAAYLDAFVGQNVLIVGQVTQLRGESAVINADGDIDAKLNRDAHLIAGNAAQLIGKVNPDRSVRVLNAVDLGPGVDVRLSNRLADISQQVKEIFVYEGGGSA